MSDHDMLLQAIEAIYASGIEADRMPTALQALNNLLGGAGATFEVVDASKMQHLNFMSVGAPTHVRTRYMEEIAATNPHIQFALGQPDGQVLWDYQHLDENQMACHPFYTDFLPTVDLRYCIGAVLQRTQEKLAVVYTQRTIKQGHVDQREITLMQQLVPHFQRAYDTAMRLKFGGHRIGVLENALEWLTDGVALLRSDGRIAYTNAAFGELARRGDGFNVIDGMIEFIVPETQHRFNSALKPAMRLREELSSDLLPVDFPVPRSDGMSAYTVALRPLVPGQAERSDAVLLLFIHDPLSRNAMAKQIFQEIYNLTHAEVHLAQALCAGMTTGAYASTRRVSLNTVYTHLRHIREKTDCNSVAELVRRFGEMRMPLRLS